MKEDNVTQFSMGDTKAKWTPGGKIEVQFSRYRTSEFDTFGEAIADLTAAAAVVAALNQKVSAEARDKVLDGKRNDSTDAPIDLSDIPF